MPGERKTRSNKGKKRGSRVKKTLTVQLQNNGSRVVKSRKERSNKGVKRGDYKKKNPKKSNKNSKNSKKKYLSKSDQDILSKEYKDIFKIPISKWKGIETDPKIDLNRILAAIPKITFDPKYVDPFSGKTVNKKNYGDDAHFYQVKFKIDAFLKYGDKLL